MKYEHVIFNQVPFSQKLCANVLHSLILYILIPCPFPLIGCFILESLKKKCSCLNQGLIFIACSGAGGQACKPGASEGEAGMTPAGFRKDSRKECAPCLSWSLNEWQLKCELPVPLAEESVFDPEQMTNWTETLPFYQLHSDSLDAKWKRYSSHSCYFF